MVAPSELSIDIYASAMEMAQTIFGDGVTVLSASYTGDYRSSGVYTGGNSTSPGVTPGDTGVILSTGHARDFTNSAGSGGPGNGNGNPWWWWGGGNSQNSNQNTDTSTNTSGPNNLSEFNALAGANTYDASFLDVAFVPVGDMMTIQFVFSSEEYPEYTNSLYQDLVTVWINGEPRSRSSSAAGMSTRKTSTRPATRTFISTTRVTSTTPRWTGSPSP